MNRCAAQGCGRWTRAGEAFCQRHGQDGSGDRDDVPEAGSGQGRLAIFRARLATGEYDAVLGPGLRGAMHDAAADQGLDPEVGALRLALARLLDEEADASRLATGVARVAGVAVQAARLRRGHDGEAEKISVFLQHELAAIDAERAEQRKGSNEAKGDESG